MNRRTIMIAMLCIGVLATLSAQPGREKAAPAATGETVAVTHELGTTNVPVDPRRILVFDLGALDILDDASISVTAIGRGATLPATLSWYADTERYPLVGSLHEPDFEMVYRQRPDLILIGTRAAPAYDELSKIAATVMITLPQSAYMETLASNINIIATIFPEKRAYLSNELAALKESIASIREEVEQQELTALFLMVNASSLSVFGLKSRFALIYDDFGFTVTDAGIQSSTHGQSASFEYLLQQKPDHLFVLDRSAATGSDDGVSAQQLLDNSLLRSLPTKITYVDPTSWYVASGGINATRMMIEDIQSALH
ncbi:MAG: ABC transporter substrate-binding protein [Sphaerochaeta sp.]|nr:ABC transporter substrate-binding protein [Sphaerochaeta sp.]MDX9916207.1 ABC transporter substrate-binding protein [Sphaerochaeta sp.]